MRDGERMSAARFGRRHAIEIKTPEQLELMRAAGLVVAGALDAVVAALRPGVTTGDLDLVARDYLGDHGATSSFLGYHGFPAVICTSVNEQIVHGIPGAQVIDEGDLVSIDCGAIVQGWHGDAAGRSRSAPSARRRRPAHGHRGSVVAGPGRSPRRRAAQ